MMISSSAAGVTWHVDDDAPGGNGQSWPQAFNELQDALDEANDGDVILVAEGTYLPGTAPTSRFLLTVDVVLLGGHAGYGAADPDARDIVNTPSILSGDVNGDDIVTFDPLEISNTSDNVNNVVVVDAGLTDQAVLDGFIISSAKDRGLTMGSIGASSPAIVNCTIRFNAGGGAYVFGSSSAPEFRGCTLQHNKTTVDGGGARAVLSKPLFLDCLVEGNFAVSTGGGLDFGGSEDEHWVINCEIRDNTSLKRGGGIATKDDLTVLNTIIVGNEGDYGGGIETEGPSVTIVNCTIADNTATDLAGGVWFIEGDALIVNSILWVSARRTTSPQSSALA